MRVEYEKALAEDVAELRDSMSLAKSTNVELSLARSRIDQFKATADKTRVEVHGKIQAILGSRKEADEFFRSVTTAPDRTDESSAPAEGAEVSTADKKPG